MKILGIHVDFHDTGAVILDNGKIIAAVNEERLSRIKFDGSIPLLSMASVLEMAHLEKKDIDLIAFSGPRPGFEKYKAYWYDRAHRAWYTKGSIIFNAFKIRPWKESFHQILRMLGVNSIKESKRVSSGVSDIIRDFQANGFKGEVKFFDHDLCHAAGAYFTSSFDKGLVAIIEGSSFKNASSFWWAEDGKLKKIHELPLPHSIGRYYETVTAILGFNTKRHAGKITGLAGFGDPKKAYHLVSPLLIIEGINVTVSPEIYKMQESYRIDKKLPKIFSGFSREDIAAAFQKRMEDVVLELISKLLKSYPTDTLMLSGGVTANVKLNMEILTISGIKNIFVHPGMSDAGQALGAALLLNQEKNSQFKPFRLDSVYFGPEFSDLEIKKVLDASGLTYTRPENLPEEVGKLLSENKVVGLFQGRMEYGPRALGNRSILYPATDKSVNDWLNKQLNRTEFMPFAPVTLAERATDCYKEEEVTKGKEALRFMTLAVHVTPYMKEKMPAAVHIDDTARPQLIDEKTNPLYYNILKEYEKITGLPSLVNTSFNMHEEPIVCRPEEAIEAFEASKLDVLVLAPFLIKRQS